MKKCVFILFVLFVASCTKQAQEATLPTVTWIDEATRSDTIITKYSLELNTLDANVYYARKNWQLNTTTTPMVAYKMITVYQADSVYLSRNDNTTNYDGPYQFKFSANGMQLTSQDLLVPPANSQGRVFVRLQ